MDNKIFEQIKKNVEEMKRFRPTLRTQVEEVLNEVVGIFEDNQTEIAFKYKGKTFKICQIEYGFNARCNANNYSWEFIEEDSRGIKHGFTDGYKCEYVDMQDFENEDIIFLAENIEEILEKINNLMDGQNEVLKSLTNKVKRYNNE